MNPEQPEVPLPPQHDPKNSPQPAGYDQYGRPLYAHPPTTPPPQPSQPQQPPAAKPPVDADGDNPQVVYMTRAVEPHEPTITPEIKAKHDASRRDFPHLNLSDGEYVISAVRRHPIGLVSIWAVVAAALLAIFVGVPFLFSTQSFFDSADMPLFSGGMILLLLGVLIVLGGVIATIVYRGNRFYLTNESVMQHIQFSLFSRKEQTISLANIEDASYRQHGFIQTLFN